jgi:hypothetical protein
MIKTIFCGSIIVFGCLAVSGVAFAYALGSAGAPAVTTATVSGYLQQAQRLMASTSSLPTAPSWLPNALNTIFQWFQQITLQGAQSTAAPVIPATLTGPLGNVTGTAQNLFAQFDTWFYGIAHFHIAIILNFIFGLVGWILGIAKNIVDWLDAIFKSAAVHS